VINLILKMRLLKLPQTLPSIEPHGLMLLNSLSLKVESSFGLSLESSSAALSSSVSASGDAAPKRMKKIDSLKKIATQESEIIILNKHDS